MIYRSLHVNSVKKNISPNYHQPEYRAFTIVERIATRPALLFTELASIATTGAAEKQIEYRHTKTH